jgi:hypothetical protein
MQLAYLLLGVSSQAVRSLPFYVGNFSLISFCRECDGACTFSDAAWFKGKSSKQITIVSNFSLGLHSFIQHVFTECLLHARH